MKKLFILLLDQLGTDRGENIDSYHSVLSPLSAGGPKNFQCWQNGGDLQILNFQGSGDFFQGVWGFSESNFQLLIKHHIS